MSKVKRGERTERIQGILKSGGSSQDLVKRLGMKPSTANFYVWRYKKSHNMEAVTRSKGSSGLRGYERGRKGLGLRFPKKPKIKKVKKELKRVRVERERQKALAPPQPTPTAAT